MSTFYCRFKYRKEVKPSKKWTILVSFSDFHRRRHAPARNVRPSTKKTIPGLDGFRPSSRESRCCRCCDRGFTIDSQLVDWPLANE